jgi:hypothetical protein
MNKLIAGFLAGVGLVFIIVLIALISGTILYFIWPIAIPAVFPGLVEKGIIAGKLSWVVSVCLTWICGILIKASQSNTNNK